MNESLLPSLSPADPSPHPGVYADPAELVRLKFRIGGFSLLPRQPVHSILAGRHASRLRGRNGCASLIVLGTRTTSQADVANSWSHWPTIPVPLCTPTLWQ